MVFLNELREAEGNAIGNVGISVLAANRGGLAAVVDANSVTRGDIFPFGGFAVVNIRDMAGFNRGGIFGKFAVSGESAADASAKGKIKSQAFMERRLVNRGEVGVVS